MSEGIGATDESNDLDKRYTSSPLTSNFFFVFCSPRSVVGYSLLAGTSWNEPDSLDSSLSCHMSRISA